MTDHVPFVIKETTTRCKDCGKFVSVRWYSNGSHYVCDMGTKTFHRYKCSKNNVVKRVPQNRTSKAKYQLNLF